MTNKLNPLRCNRFPLSAIRFKMFWRVIVLLILPSYVSAYDIPAQPNMLLNKVQTKQDEKSKTASPSHNEAIDNHARPVGPVYGGSEKFQNDPYWNDLVQFYEYFHGDNGAGIGASHQTGWTDCIARIIQGMGDITKEVLTGADAEMAAIKKTVGK